MDDRLRKIDARSVLISATAVVVLAPLYSAIRLALGRGAMVVTVFSCTAMLSATVLVGYQIYFVVQYLARRRPALTLHSSLDDWIPFWPNWVWVYGALYYGLLGLPFIFVRSGHDCFKFIGSGIVLFFVVTPLHVAFPTRCPADWRHYPVTSSAARLLRAIQQYDGELSCFPSLHCVFAGYVAASLPDTPLRFVIPLCVSLSCVFVKQHSILDVPISVLLGWLWAVLAHAVLA